MVYDLGYSCYIICYHKAIWGITPKILNIIPVTSQKRGHIIPMLFPVEPWNLNIYRGFVHVL